MNRRPTKDSKAIATFASFFIARGYRVVVRPETEIIVVSWARFIGAHEYGEAMQFGFLSITESRMGPYRLALASFTQLKEAEARAEADAKER